MTKGYRSSLPLLLLVALLAVHHARANPKPAPEAKPESTKAVANPQEKPEAPEVGDQEEDALKETAHPSPEKKSWKGDSESNSKEPENESYRKFSGIRYTPQDLAEYILKTRDEEGVALAIEELLQEGLIRRDEAIQYLESVKQELGNMKQQYALAQEAKATWHPNTVANTYPSKQEKSLQFHARMKELQGRGEKRRHFEQPRLEEKSPIRGSTRTEKPNAEERVLPEARQTSVRPTQQVQLPQDPPKNATRQEGQSDNDKRASDTDGKVKEAASNALYEEYLLEKVIYQLAKDMFTQSLVRDDASAEQLLSKFASFLENELSQKRFSKATQEKILDTVSTALIESLRERLYSGN